MHHGSKMGIGLLKSFLLLLTGIASVGLIGFLLPTPGSQLTPAGIKHNSAFYLTMRDGVKIAVDLWLPSGLEPTQRIPTTLRFTRYARAQEPGFIRRIALGLGLDKVHPVMQMLFDADYAVMLVDARGSGASSGNRGAEISPEEVADMGEVVEWVTQQSWSNGKVAAFGVSYVGTTSEMLTINAHPAVKAVLPLFSDFDGYTGLVKPGGVGAIQFVSAWGQSNQYIDNNELCQGETGLLCVLSKLWTTGIKPVDSDTNGRELTEIIRQRNNYDVSASMKALIYRDDPLSDHTLNEVFPAGHSQAISKANVPMQAWVSWLDAATVDGAIARYNSFSNPQQLIITPFNHGGSKNADPFSDEFTPAIPSRHQQYQQRIAFLDRFLKTEHSAPPPNNIRYYTLGEAVWKETAVWPPAGLETRRWYFNANQALTKSAPTTSITKDNYVVNYTATTGPRNRWLANLSGSRDIVYPDRAVQDKKLVIYDSEPMETAIEITGRPVVTLQVDSNREDGAFHVYFEDVAPDGSVTYITEGILRAIHRKVSPEAPPYYIEGPYHSFNRKDAMPLTKGEVNTLEIGLITTSVMIKAGHRLRIAIAGHDASVFERIPSTGISVVNIHRSANFPSFVEFPVVSNRTLK